MKKIALIVMAAVIACLCMVSCGGSDVEGKWECCKVIQGGTTYEDTYNGVPLGVVFRFDLQSGGKGTMYAFSGTNDLDETALTWEVDGDTVKIMDENGKNGEDFKLSGGKLSGKIGFEVEMKKVDKFQDFDIDELRESILANMNEEN